MDPLVELRCLGFTRAYLAELLRVSSATITQWMEGGPLEASQYDRLERLRGLALAAREQGITPSWFFTKVSQRVTDRPRPTRSGIQVRSKYVVTVTVDDLFGSGQYHLIEELLDGASPHDVVARYDPRWRTFRAECAQAVHELEEIRDSL